MAAGPTYKPIATQTLSSAAASITFSSIPQGYTDLVVIARVADSNLASNFGDGFTLNTDTVSNGKLSFTTMYGDGTTAASFRWTTATASMALVPGGVGSTTLNQGGVSIANIMNYSNSTTYKTIITRSSAPSNAVYTYVTLWQDTSAINQIVYYPNDGTNTLLSGSTISIYGITAA